MKYFRTYRWLTLLLAMLGAMPALAQYNLVMMRDSLINALAKETQDSLKVRLLAEIGETWVGNNPTKAHQYYDEAIQISQKIKSKSLVAHLMVNKGYLYSRTGQSAKAIQILQECIKLAENMKNKIMVANSQEFIGYAFQSQGDTENALKYAQLCYDHYESVYRKEGFKQGGHHSWLEGYTGSNMTLGDFYLSVGKIDTALKYETVAYEFNQKTVEKNKNSYFMFRIPYVLGLIYLKKEQPKKAKRYFDESLSVATSIKDSVGLAAAWLGMAKYYEKIQQPDSVVFYAEKSLSSCLNTKRFEMGLEAGKLLKKYYQQNINNSKALYYSDLLVSMQDSLSSVEKVKQGQRFLYEEQQNQQAIAQLKTDNQNRMVRYGLVIGLLLLGLVSVILWLNYHRKQRENHLLDNKIRLQESEFAHKLAETEMTALRAQMNPHFIFNCLNSIKLYTLENDNLKATEYMTKFSRLIRLVLENSRSERITLANELETLELYIEMEAMRFKDKVAYEITVADDVDTQYIEIPPLLIQPYIENAIWHGLMHKEGGGLITIAVKTLHATSLLQITITDNGIGRAASAALKSKSATKQKSFGLKMTSERIELINQLYKTNTTLRIEDLEDSKGNATGTKVIVEIPV